MKKATILIVEDDRELVKVLVTLLKTEGYRTMVAYNGKSALKAVERKPDLVILDLRLPDIDGLKILKDWKEDSRYRSIPVLVITAITQDSTKSDNYWMVETGADDFITKPFEPFNLLKRVKDLLRTHEKI